MNQQPLHGDKHTDHRYWPTSKAFEAVGLPVPEFIAEWEAAERGAT